ncbi:hypothetical protein GETHLI_26290 [Geothrix limicola]|uniref:PKD domain-containing protein n=1 Tax=Geothrix limicola TaxID=2927978 RepID=A0ABQ5QHG6_9BACT|nr:PKD domain-containing protein [Geothrix limicola]GLH74127.1 hypothetical protein GETHLI_26290 [Geothrix limicola]
MQFRRSAAIGLCTALIAAVQAPAQTPSPSFSFTTYKTGFQQPVGVVFDQEGHAYVWEKGGMVKLVEPNGGDLSVLLDLSEEVSSPSGDDHGLLGFALDPDFANNGYVYLWYTVERALLYNQPDLPHDVSGATQGRCTRYTVVNHHIDPATRHVVLGQDLMDGPPIMGTTHGVGTCFFGADGSLMLSVGDGSLGDPYGAEGVAHGIITQAMSDLKQLRAQDNNSLSGKLLRVDKVTGEGLPTNPHYDPNNKRSAQSRMYVKGLRNPYRVTNIAGVGLGNGPGYFLVSDTGENTWEEVALYTAPDDNGGWPYYEGFDRARINEQIAFPLPSPEPPTMQPLYSWPHPENAAKGLGTVGKIKVNNQAVLITDLNNSPNILGTSSTGNTFYPKNVGLNRYNHLLDDAVLAADYTQDVLRAITFNQANSTVDFNNPNKLFVVARKGAIVDLYTNPYDGYIYAITYGAVGAEVARLNLVSNLPPVAVIKTTDSTATGSGSLTVQFYGDQSYDPDDATIGYAWNFGDGSPTSTEANPIHTFNASTGNPETRQVTLTVTDPHANASLATQTVSLNNLPPQIQTLSVKNNATGAEISSIAVGGNSPTSYDVTLDATVTDDRTAASSLTYTWTVDRHHNNHIHYGQPITGKTVTTQLVPEGGCGEGASYWFAVSLVVTDQDGASATAQKQIYQDCAGLTPQTITVSPVPDQSILNGSLSIAASSSSGLPVTFQKVSGPFEVNAQTGLVTFSGTPGEAVLYAFQHGNTVIGNAYPKEIRFNIVNPPVVTAVDAHGCGAGPITLTASSANSSIAWFATQTGGFPLAIGPTFTPTISQNTTYYVQATGGFANLASVRKPVLASIAGRSIPFAEDFQGDGLPSGWSVKNSNQSALTWSQVNYGNGPETVKRSFSYQDYQAGADVVNGQAVDRDELRTPALDFTNVPFPRLTFDLAYAYNNADDGLSVWVSTDCGATFVPAGFDRKGQALATVGTQQSPFYPQGASQWASQSVDLSDFAGNPNVIVAFRNTPALGNNLYLDNVRVENVPFAPVASFTTPASYCLNQPVPFTNTSTGGATNSYLWTFLDHNSNALGTSTAKHPTWTFTNEEWVSARLTVTNSQGTSISYGPSWILVKSIPTITSTTPGSRNGNGSVVLGAQASNSAPLSWYATPTGSTALGSGTSFTTPNLSTTTTFYVEASNGGCTSTRVAVLATINSGVTDTTPPTAPANLTATGTTQNATNLSWTASTDDTGVTGYDVYQNGNLVAGLSGSSLGYAVTGLRPGTGYAFLVKARDAAGNISASSNLVNITTLSDTTTAPAASFTVSTPISLGQPVAFTNTSTGGSTNTYLWTFLDHNNNPLGTSLATNPTWTFSNEEWVSARLVATNPLGTSTSYGSGWVYANPIPAITSVTPGSRVGTGQVTLGAQASNSGTISWYASLTGGNPLGTGTSFTTPVISTTTTYYVEASKGGIPSPRTAVVATVSGSSTDATAPAASFTMSAPVCLGQPVVFTNTSTGGTTNTYLWTFLDHNNNPLGTSLATNPTWTFSNEEWVSARLVVTNALGTSTSYGPNWVYAKPVPTVLSTTPAARSGNGSVMLGAQASNSGTISWYTTLSGGTALWTGNSFTTPSLSATTTYYAEASNGVCPSPRVAVVATVNP